MDETIVKTIPLGKQLTYISQYTPSLLFPVARQLKRTEIGITDKLPFAGSDLWNAYELSWLDKNGKPHIAIAEFTVPCTSPNLIESKSIKLYLNSFNQTQFKDHNHVAETIQQDLTAIAGETVKVKLILPPFTTTTSFTEFNGDYLDNLPITVDTYLPQPNFLITENTEDKIEEKLYSNLLKSNCLVTKQPDWASVFIHYYGRPINHAGLLKYIISLREHDEFHEQCIERIYINIWQKCKPEKLTVYARYTRRGGLDINPFRSNFEQPPINQRHFRQ